MCVVQFPDEARCELLGWLRLHALQAHLSFVAQIFDLVARRIGDIAKTADLAGTCHEQIALDQLRETEIGIAAHQAVHLVECDIQAVIAYLLQALGELGLVATARLGCGIGRAGEAGNDQRGEQSDAHGLLV